MKRTRLKWLGGAPSQVYDCFDLGDGFYADRYTVFVAPEVEYQGVKWVSMLNSSASLHVSGWSEVPTHRVAEYRRRFARKRIAWSSLPENVRDVVIRDTSEGVND